MRKTQCVKRDVTIEVGGCTTPMRPFRHALIVCCRLPGQHPAWRWQAGWLSHAILRSPGEPSRPSPGCHRYQKARRGKRGNAPQTPEVPRQAEPPGRRESDRVCFRGMEQTDVAAQGATSSSIRSNEGPARPVRGAGLHRLPLQPRDCRAKAADHQLSAFKMRGAVCRAGAWPTARLGPPQSIRDAFARAPVSIGSRCHGRDGLNG